MQNHTFVHCTLHTHLNMYICTLHGQMYSPKHSKQLKVEIVKHAVVSWVQIDLQCLTLLPYVNCVPPALIFLLLLRGKTVPGLCETQLPYPLYKRRKLCCQLHIDILHVMDEVINNTCRKERRMREREGWREGRSLLLVFMPMGRTIILPSPQDNITVHQNRDEQE